MLQISQFWRKLSLVQQFTIVATVVVGIIMTALGGWISDKIENSVIKTTALSAALYMDRFVEPLVQDLASTNDLSLASKNTLLETVETAGFSQHIFNIKIWRPDGTIVFSANTELIGTRPPISDSLAEALRGVITPEFDSLGDDENSGDRLEKRPLLEIYVPLRDAESNRIIGVAEFYQYADDLQNELLQARLEGVLMVAGFALLMLGALIGIVGRGSQTIVTQQHILNDRISDLSKSLAQNVELRHRVDEANRRATESNERFLRRVSAELHDGPVQLVGLALLRLDAIGPMARRNDAEDWDRTLEIIRSALKDALSEIRGLSGGMALPELEKLTLAETIDLAISNHERRTGTPVEAEFPSQSPETPSSIKTCLYRFVQEGLNNAFRHADGVGQKVDIEWDGRELKVSVRDQGGGFSAGEQTSGYECIGLAGLRDRVESLGGSMLIREFEGEGALLQASFIVNEGGAF